MEKNGPEAFYDSEIVILGAKQFTTEGNLVDHLRHVRIVDHLFSV